MSFGIKVIACLSVGCGLLAVPLLARAEIVSFKDADKIKSWDAWTDHKGPVAWTERRCVTRENLLKLDPGLRTVGWFRTRAAKDIKSDMWSVGCETMDRDYADWDLFKRFLPELGVKRARFFSGWAKTEQKRGVYDFAWLDRQLRECRAMGVKPWVCISYGNPVWGSDFRLGMRVKQVTGNSDSFAAWLRYVRALVARYQDIVDEWEIWNEPFGQAEEYAEMFFRTAKAVREVQPTAKCIVTAISMQRDLSKSDYAVVLEKLKSEGALGYAKYFAYHPYAANPDMSYEAGSGQFGWQMALPLRRFVRSYSPEYDIIQGEVGCPSQLEYAHALAEHEWTEYSQAKWNLRRAIGDNVRGIRSSLFTLIDLKYTFMLQSFGLVRANLLKEPVYRRPSYFAMQNVYSFFDEETRPVGIETRKSGGRELTVARYERQGEGVAVLWFSDRIPSSLLEYTRMSLSLLRPDIRQSDVVWFDLMTGRVCELDGDEIPVWDSPVVLAPRSQISLRKDFRESK